MLLHYLTNGMISGGGGRGREDIVNIKYAF
jgi:hypothetical protein